MKFKHDIHALTVVPYIIAERVSWTIIEKEMPTLTGIGVAEMVASVAPKLVRKAETLFDSNDFFRRSLLDKRADQRRTLEMWMEHWCAAIVKNKGRKNTTNQL